MKYEFCRVASEKAKLQLNCNATRQGKKGETRYLCFCESNKVKSDFLCGRAFQPEILTKRICISILRIQFGYLQHFSIFSIMFHIFLPYIIFHLPLFERNLEEWNFQPKELPDSGLGTQNMERIQKLTERRLVFGVFVGFEPPPWLSPGSRRRRKMPEIRLGKHPEF